MQFEIGSGCLDSSRKQHRSSLRCKHLRPGIAELAAQVEYCFAERIAMRYRRAHELSIAVGDETVSRHWLPEISLGLSSKRLGREDDCVVCELAEVQSIFGCIRVHIGVRAVVHDEVETVEVRDLRQDSCESIEGRVKIECAALAHGCRREDIEQEEHRALAVCLALLAAVIACKQLLIEEDSVMDERPLEACYV